jgi:hypothetical protein
MRDINRIDKVTDELNKLWKEKYPDFRFGQLFEYVGDKVLHHPKGAMDTFYTEDDVWLEVLKKLNNSK